VDYSLFIWRIIKETMEEMDMLLKAILTSVPPPIFLSMVALASYVYGLYLCSFVHLEKNPRYYIKSFLSIRKPSPKFIARSRILAFLIGKGKNLMGSLTNTLVGSINNLGIPYLLSLEHDKHMELWFLGICMFGL
jgi:hypothetical protein